MPKRQRTYASYDEDARKEYLTGFHKRKVMRQKEAENNKLKLIKEEKQRQRAEKKLEIERMARAAEAAREDEDEGDDDPDDCKDAVVEVGRPSQPVVEELVGDEFTRKSFGAEAVVVTTRFGFDHSGVDEGDETFERLAAAAPKKLHRHFDSGSAHAVHRSKGVRGRGHRTGKAQSGRDSGRHGLGRGGKSPRGRSPDRGGR